MFFGSGPPWTVSRLGGRRPGMLLGDSELSHPDTSCRVQMRSSSVSPNALIGARHVLGVSGDSQNNTGPAVLPVRDAAFSSVWSPSRDHRAAGVPAGRHRHSDPTETHSGGEWSHTSTHSKPKPHRTALSTAP